MNQSTELELVEALDEAVSDSSDLIGVTFASGIHESDLLTYLERAGRLDGEAC